MDKPTKYIDVVGEDGIDLSKAMQNLNEITRRVINCTAFAAVLVSEEGDVTLMIHPGVLNDPVKLTALIHGIRLSCDVYEQEHITRKMQ